MRVQGCLQSNQLRLLGQAAVEGVGIAMQPTFGIWEHLAAGRLQTIFDDWSAEASPSSSCFPAGASCPRRPGC